MLETMGVRGGRIGAWASIGCRARRAGSIRSVWKAPPPGRGQHGLDRVFGPGHDGLSARVEVGDHHRSFGSVLVGADLLEVFHRQADDRSHGARPRPGGRRHGPAAGGDQIQRHRPVQAAGGDEGRELAEAVAGDRRRPDVARL
jgi:hypothetical protein